MQETQTSRADDARQKRRRKFPRREQLVVRSALSKLGVTRYCEVIRIWNKHYTTREGIARGGWQWVDFVFKYNGKLYAILFKQEWTGGAALFQKAWLEQKKLYLQERNLPTLVLRRDLSEQDVYAKIYIFLKLHK